MAGTFGYELDPAKMTDEERREIRKQIVEYKKYAQLVQNGLYYRLSNPFAEEIGAWEFVSEDGKEVLVNVVMLEIHGNMTVNYVKVKGLCAGQFYKDSNTGKIYPADPAYYNFTIKGASKEKYKIVVDGMTTYQFINVDGEWYYDVNADGEIDEAEMDKRDIESSYYYPEIIFLSDGRVAMQMEITLNYTEEDDVNTYYGWPAKGSLAINIFYTRK